MQHQQRVFGLYDRRTKKRWIQSVARKDGATLLPLIQQFVRPGSRAYSDAWAAYNNLGQHGYVHGAVVHQENFVDLWTGVHTQNVEGYWSRANHKIKSVYGSRSPPITSYLGEFMWRERYGLSTSEAFANILAHIVEHYQFFSPCLNTHDFHMSVNIYLFYVCAIRNPRSVTY